MFFEFLETWLILGYELYETIGSLLRARMKCSHHPEVGLGDRGSKWIASPGFEKPDLHALSFISTSLYAPILKLGIFLKNISTRLGVRKIISNSSEILPIVNYVKIRRQLLLLLRKSN